MSPLVHTICHVNFPTLELGCANLWFTQVNTNGQRLLDDPALIQVEPRVDSVALDLAPKLR